MAFTDPQSVTVNAVAVSLPRTGQTPTGSQYKSADGNVTMTISHAYGKRARSTVRIDHQKISPNVFLPSQNVRQSMSTYIVVDRPRNNEYTAAEVKQVVDALTAYLTASTGARVTQLLGGEN